MNNMRRDPVGAAKKHGKDLDDVRGSAGILGKRANAARGKRGEAEGAAGGNASAINGKRGELSAAQGHSAAARRKYDADSAANPTRKKALDKREAEISGLKKARDSANPEGARPQRRPQDDAMRSRKGDIDGQVPRHKKAKDDAADTVNANRQKLADLNAKKPAPAYPVLDSAGNPLPASSSIPSAAVDAADSLPSEPMAPSQPSSNVLAAPVEPGAAKPAKTKKTANQ
jgi:hypothetical protein